MTDITVPTRRELLAMIGKTGGGLAMYQAMTALGHAAESRFAGPPKLTGARPGASGARTQPRRLQGAGAGIQ